MFPYTDTVVSKLVPGRTLVAALEAGVSRIPAHEGCFPQVSGIRFRFDPAKPPFSRIESPVLVGDEELDMEAMYTVVMPAYIGRGKVRQCGCFVASYCHVSAIVRSLLVRMDTRCWGSANTWAAAKMVPRSKMFSGRTFPLSQAQSTSSGRATTIRVTRLHFDPRINCIQYWTAASARRLSWLRGQQAWAAKEIRLKCLHERERLF